MNEFLSMGGQGAFVWGAYGMTALLFALEVVLVRRCSAATRRSLGQVHTAAPAMRLEGRRGI
ncbi:heme exporter protein CcmD [Noviherbaspirillum sedimenti]|uniref:Heme exporter protein D n=1 Tax=Noviherbaspirillum sedimenti TaxID=2320865 RepID=A0A3A3GCG0_9BURK|nr:heme exporter protein CcmD [Noviherbaspirillum sedimenti]